MWEVRLLFVGDRLTQKSYLASHVTKVNTFNRSLVGNPTTLLPFDDEVLRSGLGCQVVTPENMSYLQSFRGSLKHRGGIMGRLMGQETSHPTDKPLKRSKCKCQLIHQLH